MKSLFANALLLAIGLFSLSALADDHSAGVDATAGGSIFTTPSVNLNQLGYSPAATKIAIINAKDYPAGEITAFEVIDQAGKQVFSGGLSETQTWPYAKGAVRAVDFTSLTEPGQYRLILDGKVAARFEIKSSVYDQAHSAALKAFYFNRAGTALLPEHAGKFARAAGHKDTSVKVHKSAATKQRPKGTQLSAPYGWYDAGDYGKYTVNSGISTYTLLAAYQHFPQLYKKLKVGIPESTNTLPDLLDEVLWNLRWMSAMQDSDGGVYHKLTALNFSSMSATPAGEKSQRWMIGKSVTASLNFAAVMAVASRVYGEFEPTKELSEKYGKQAIKAYAWAKANPKELYKQPRNVKTGEYGDNDAKDEFAWAAAEMFLLTQDKRYFDDFQQLNIQANDDLSWGSVATLAYVSLLHSAKTIISDEDYGALRTSFMKVSDEIAKVYSASAYRVSMGAPSFVWGSNSVALNRGLILFQAFRLSGDQRYREGAMASLDYIFGRNPTGYSYVTGFGYKSPQNIHHRPSTSDEISSPVPGFLAGGPHTGRQDGCDYPADMPATNYADTVCSYSTNEIAINWNAPLVYMLAAAITSQ